MQAIGFSFPGQTEFFAARCEVENFAMLLTGGALTVALVTADVPLRKVAEVLNEREIIRVGKLLAGFLAWRKKPAQIFRELNPEILSNPEMREAWRRSLSYESPRIAVAGLNPHAGESGALGSEEIEIIKPAVKNLRLNKFYNARFEGPISPDTVFNRAVSGEFDAVLCMYHDQGLIPLKLHAFDQGVNVTLGLPIVRTSPDHGTAFEIAGKGIARPNSMIAAINLAAELARKRNIAKI
jgi:4-hydroxythreonine-4-phosphate dehydrogenase